MAAIRRILLHRTPDPRDAEIARLQDALADATTEAGRHLAALQSLHADFTNYRRRTDEERSGATVLATEGLLLDLFGIADELLRARRASTNDPAADELIELFGRKLAETLRRAGVTSIAPTGAFDPAVAEALALVDGPTPGRVVEVFGLAWFAGDRLLRPARVTVAREPEPIAPEGTEPVEGPVVEAPAPRRRRRTK